MLEQMAPQQNILSQTNLFTLNNRLTEFGVKETALHLTINLSVVLFAILISIYLNYRYL